MPPSNPSNASTPPAALQCAFKDVAFSHSKARKVLDAEKQGQNVNVPQALASTEQLRIANHAFKTAWDSQTTLIDENSESQISVFTPDFLALKSFLEVNACEASAEELLKLMVCKIDKHGFIAEILITNKPNDGSSFKVEPLVPLKGLKRLWLKESPSDPAQVAKLSSLECLIMKTGDTSNLPKLSDLKLRSLCWHLWQTKDKSADNVSLDITPFSKLTTLESLSIEGDPDIPNISIQSLEPLAKLESLSVFALGRATIDKSFPRVSMSNTKKLILQYCTIEDASWIDCFSSLERLIINLSNVLCESIKYPPTLRQFEFLGSVDDYPHLAAILRPLLNLKKLTDVNIPLEGTRKFSAEEKAIIEQLKKKGVKFPR